jgi:hypothetical protein
MDMEGEEKREEHCKVALTIPEYTHGLLDC